MKHLILNELFQLHRVRAFTPNVHAQWMEEENQRSFEKWCRESLDPALPVFLSEPPRREPLLKLVKGLLP